MTSQTLNLIGARASVEVVQETADGSAETFFTWSATQDDWYGVNKSDRFLIMRRRTGGVDFEEGIVPYNPTVHRFWRIEHRDNGVEPAAIVFSTSGTGADGEWSERHRVTMLQRPLSSLRVKLGAGAWNNMYAGTQNPMFDNFELCPP